MKRRRGIMAAADGAATDAAAAMESLPPLSAYPTLSAYELQRMENMRENEERLAELGLAPGGGIVNVRPQRQQNKTREKPKGERRPAAVGERKSSRVAGARALDLYVESEDARGAVTLGGDARALKLARQQREKAVASEGAAHACTMRCDAGCSSAYTECLSDARCHAIALDAARRHATLKTGYGDARALPIASAAEWARHAMTDPAARRAAWAHRRWGAGGPPGLHVHLLKLRGGGGLLVPPLGTFHDNALEHTLRDAAKREAFAQHGHVADHVVGTVTTAGRGGRAGDGQHRGAGGTPRPHAQHRQADEHQQAPRGHEPRRGGETRR